MAAAEAMTSRESIVLLGLVHVVDQDSLSTAARPVQQTRNRMQVIAQEHGVQARTKVRASHQPWEELTRRHSSGAPGFTDPGMALPFRDAPGHSG